MNHLKYLIYLLIFLYSSSLFAQNKTNQTIKQFVQKGVIQLQDQDNNYLINYQTLDKFIPASIQKITVALVAIEILGLNFRFQTKFYKNAQNDLLIVGGGDPFFTSEEIHLIAQNLKNQGLYSIRKIYINDTKFSHAPIAGIGTSLRPYDARNGSLVVNFNTIYLKKDKNGKVRSAEKQTPLTPLARSKGKILKKNKTSRLNLSKKYSESLRYSVELIQSIFKKNNITIATSDFKRIEQTKEWKLIYTHKNSKSLASLLHSMLEFSNNYIANQITMQLGGKKYGFPTHIKKGSQVLTEYLINHLNIPQKDFYIEEGSGISRKNFITPKAMFTILDHFKKYHFLLKQTKDFYLKSGTLKGIYNYAGYLKEESQLSSFLIITYNQKHNNRNTLLKIIKKNHNKLKK